MNKFKDPSSPYYLAPGTQGPAHEADHQAEQASSEQEPQHIQSLRTELSYSASRRAGREYAEKHGFDARTCVEVPIAWGEQDMFRHVNNVHFGRYFEVSG